MLAIDNLHVSYGHITALSGVSIQVPRGSIVSIIGSNGAGKTTLLNSISGIVKPKQGSIRFEGKELTRIPHEIVKLGLVQVPEGRKIFAGLTVEENLLAGGYILKDSSRLKANAEKMMKLYPILEKRRNQQAGTLSGGEQQMLAVCRGLMSEPKMILLDEPSLGLAPIIVKGIFDLIAQIREQGITVLLVEQNAKKALALCDYAYVLENGRVTLEGNGKELLCDPAVKKAYLGERE
ncbi:MAG: ABC transporter ATP-binding protein [Veillonellaceae bacterium]|jgi:branched-chain amino acid transport system ATP-binding protein|nr:ABC transporter ATP-binding protein [Veillonellaceae bacterium]